MEIDFQKWDVQALSRLMHQAGQIALSYYDAPPSEIKCDGSVVTAADKAIEDLLAETLDSPDEGLFLIGEETVDSRGESYVQNALRQTAYIVDPIDGTACYAAHVPTWGISLMITFMGI